MKFTLLLSLLILAGAIFGQVNTTKQIVEVYQPGSLNPGELAMQIPVDFNDDELLTIFPDSLHKLTVQRVDLVYSTFKTASNFNQEELNQNRIKALQAVWPSADDPKILWQEIGQNSATDKKSAQQLFHGFVIYYRPTPTKKTIEKEMAYIDAVLSGKEPTVIDLSTSEASNTELSDQTLDHQPRLTADTKTIAEKVSNINVTDETVGYQPCTELHTFTVTTSPEGLKKIQDSLRAMPRYIEDALSWSGEIEEEKEYAVSWLEKYADCEAASTGAEMGVFYSPYIYDPGDYNIVEEIYARNASWTNTLIVMDVTGSMSPYIAKTMLWAKSTQAGNHVKAFTFFNDGNNLPDRAKVTGSVGGIYSIPNETFDAVYDEMRSTMRKGGGGDAPENNMEATLSAVKAFPNSGEIVMVADNWATPRDLELVRELDQPVHVILCGATAGINIDYIRLAYATGGSVHTIEEDLEMRGLKPGKTFQIGDTYFTLFNGKIEIAQNKL